MFGPVGALYFLGLSYGFFRVFAPSTLSDTWGLILGLLAVAPLLEGVYRRSLVPFAMACLIISVGQMVRPGTIFILPALGLWGMYTLKKEWTGRLVTAGVIIGAMALPVLVNKACLLYGPDDAESNENFLLTFYGLTIGTNWKEAEAAIDSTKFELREVETRNDAVYRRAFENIKKSPGTFLGTLVYNLGFSLVTLPLHVGDMLFAMSIRPGGFSAPLLAVFGSFCIILFVPVIRESWYRLRQRDLVEGLFWSGAILAMVATFPIIIRDGSFRVLAATYPVFLLFICALLSGRRIESSKTEGDETWRVSTLIVGVLLVLVAGGPFVARLMRGDGNMIQADQGTVVAVRNEIMAVNVVQARKRPQSIAQSLKNRTTTWEVDRFRHACKFGRLEFSDSFAEREPPFAVVLALNYSTGDKRYLVLDETVDSFAQMCYEFKFERPYARWVEVSEYGPLSVTEAATR